MPASVTAAFVAPMLLLRTDKLPDDPRWGYELKLDGYRAIGLKAGRSVQLRSRHDNDLAGRYPAVAEALAKLPANTVVDGELVALDEQGRPSFQLLQNYAVAKGPLLYFVFDVMVVGGRDLTGEPLSARRGVLEGKILPKLTEPVRYVGFLDAPLPALIQSVKAGGLEGLVAKRLDSRYEPGQRSGAWLKMRINRAQEFVIGGYTAGNPFDALVFGYYDHGELIYAARTRNGFTPAVRGQLFKRFRPLETDQCPFANLPEKKSGRWGTGLTATKMAQCRWLKPVLVGQFEFVEWTDDHHLRHTRFVALREDKDAHTVMREP
ncbi:MAG TPA: non-homologous end-joining DNA ligase [Vicinamibacterales bacterium]|nr:non-homologous end-joining DNA ligase [Vicinamibacterales bacterium]